MWEEQLDRVPRLGRVGEHAATSTTCCSSCSSARPVPWELRWREMVPPPQWTASDWLATLRTQQAPWLYDDHRPCSTSRRTAAPAVQYLTATDPTATRSTCHSCARATPARRTSPRSPRSPAPATRAAASSTCARTRSPCSKRCWPSPPCRSWTRRRRRSWSTASPSRIARRAGFVRKGRPHPRPRPGRGARRRSGRRCSSRRHARSPRRPLPAPSSAVHDQVATRPRHAPTASTHRRAGEPGATDSPASSPPLDVLAPAPADELEWAFRGVLDLFSSRLDAWFTSFATARLDELARRPARRASTSGATAGSRTSAPTAVPAADSLGYIAAPSLAHAVAAALLRSGRQAHRAEDAFDLDLLVGRVREALTLLEGVAAGQPLAALLGYRIERRLTDAGLADLIVPCGSPHRCRPAPATSTSRSSRWPPATSSTGSGCSPCSPHANSGSAARPAAGERGPPDPARGRAAGRRRHVRRGQRRAVRRGRAPDRGRQPRSGGAAAGRPRPPGATGRARRHPHAAGRRDGHEPGRGRAARLGDGAGGRVAGTRRPRRAPSLASTTGSAASSATRRCSPARAAAPSRGRRRARRRHRPRTGERRRARPVAAGLRAHRRPAGAERPTELEARLAAVLAAQVADPSRDDRIELDDLSLLHTRDRVGVAPGERLPAAAGDRSGARRGGAATSSPAPSTSPSCAPASTAASPPCARRATTSAGAARTRAGAARRAARP